jgi:hypothetical protein
MGRDFSLQVSQLQDALEQLGRAREELKRELSRQRSRMGKNDGVQGKPLVNIFKYSYKTALDIIKSLPPETPGLRDAVETVLANDFVSLQAVGLPEPEKLLRKSMDEIMQAQVKFAYAAFEQSGNSPEAFATLLAVYSEALGIGTDESSLHMKATKIVVQNWANKMKY